MLYLILSEAAVSEVYYMSYDSADKSVGHKALSLPLYCEIGVWKIARTIDEKLLDRGGL